MGKGKVYLVGAGPGDPDLLTLKGARLLSDCDAVLYDRLVSPAVLERVSKRARKVYVGKDVGSSGAQADINDLMVSEAKKGGVVVRLKGGDPLLFGRGGEEAQTLRKNGIDFEIVPGVSSALAGPAYAGIPLTHRDYSSSVLIIAGHEADDKSRALDWEAVGRVAETIVVMMGAATASQTAKRMVAGGISADTPAAVIESATTSRQRVSLLSLGSLVKTKGNPFRPPCIIVIGRVASLAKELGWFKTGKRDARSKTATLQ